MTLTKDDLLGAWQLAEMYAEAEDGTRTYPMGRDARGVIMYTHDGHMSAITHHKERFLPADQRSDEDIAAAWSTYFNYAGTWTLDGDTVAHTIAHALDPNMVGLTLKRQVDHKGSRMAFTGLAPDGKTKNVIVWRR